MAFFCLFQILKSDTRRNRAGWLRRPPLKQGPACRRRSFVPSLDRLEDRTVLNTFTVKNLNDSSSGSLRQAVLDANAHAGADLIEFADGLHGTIILTSGQLSVTDAVTIHGPGAGMITVSGRDASRVFDIARNHTVEIDGLTLTHGKANQGGALRNAGRLTLSRDVLSQSQASGAGMGQLGGGGIFNQTGATLILFQTEVSGNRALGNDVGGGILNQARATLVLSQSTLSNNQSLTIAGGGLQNEGIATFTNSLVLNNQSPFGGGIRNDGTLTVTDSAFVGNLSLGGAGVAVGAALLNISTASIFNSTFSGNVASADLVNGGAILNVGSLTLTNSFVTGNVAVGRDQADGVTTIGQALGGGILNAGSLIMSGSGVSGNLAKGGNLGDNDPDNSGNDNFTGAGVGGGIFNVGELDLIDSTVSGNQAIGGNSVKGIGGPGQGGGILHGGGTLFIQDGTIAGNSAVGGAGAPTFRGGVATGGGIDDEGNQFVATNLELAGNSAIGGTGGDGGKGGTGFGGGLSLGFGATATLTGCILHGNLARGGDGGIFSSPDGTGAGDGGNGVGGAIGVGEGTLFGATSDNSSVTLSGSTIAGNLAQGGNGGFLDGNGGDGLGGGVFAVSGSTVMILQTTVAGNEADGGFTILGGDHDGKGQGGGVYIASGAAVRDDMPALISGNKATTSDPDVFGTIVPP